jgi:DNA helicase-2/ATP-dependent DNA helicase PcrA
MDLISELNPQQKQAVTAGTGQILVLAGPGSGKTRVLTHRVAYLIGNMGIRPYNILAVTFTNKAAREMENRIAALLRGETRGLWLGTFHGICARILRRETDIIGYRENFVIYDGDDQDSAIKRIIREMKLDEKQYRYGGVHAAISRAKNELISPEEYPIQNYRDEKIKQIYLHYQDILRESNAMDFDDLLFWTATLLENNPVVREKYARLFEHILVDEFQDTNQAQYTLVKHLASFHNNIFVVGDIDQSIYRWRGADYRNLQRFQQDFPEAQEILLEQNYRSTQYILDAAVAVINRNSHRKPKRLFTNRGQGEKLVLYESPDDYSEASYVVETINQIVSSRRAQPGDCAVMYRTNAQSRLLEESFLRAGLPYRLVGAQRFYGRKEVKDVIAYLRLVHNPNDLASLGRVINVPPRGIGDKTFSALNTCAQQIGIATGDLVLDLGRGPESSHWASFSGRGAAMLADFGSLLANWQTLKSEYPLPNLFDRVLSDIGYQSFLADNDPEGIDRWENVQELRRLAVEFQDRGLTDFLENVALVSDQDTLPESPNAPTLMTLHAAKGLEFPVVFIVGLDDGLLPHSRSFEEPEEMEEERRLFYVGLTRAKDRLFLVRAGQRGTYGSSEETVPSRFLDDIPDNILDCKQRLPRRWSSASYSWKSESRYSQGSNHKTWAVPIQRQSAPILEQHYPAGTRVKHPVWGEGLVVDSRLQDDDETVDIFFESVGFKRVAASIAKLEII